MAGRVVRFGMLALTLGAFACASASSLRELDTTPENYLNQCAFKREPGNDWRLLRWREQQMPLRVYLPPPPPDVFDDAEAVHEAVRSGILAWEGVASPGVPSFAFVDTPSEAQIPVQWNASNAGSWYIAQVMYLIRNDMFGVQNLLLTGRWNDGQLAEPAAIRAVVIHEMGHALGIGGHSTSPIDIMWPSYQPDVHDLSDRDRATLALLYAAPIGKRMSGAKKYR